MAAAWACLFRVSGSVIVDFDAATGPADMVGDIMVEVAIGADGEAALGSISSTGPGAAAAEVAGSVGVDAGAAFTVTLRIATGNGRQTGIGLVGVGNNFIDPGETMTFSFDSNDLPPGSSLLVTEVALDPDQAGADASMSGLGPESSALHFGGTVRESFPVDGIDTAIEASSGTVNNFNLHGGSTSRYQFAALSFDVVDSASGEIPPRVMQFSADPVFLSEGGSSRLSWEVAGPDSITIDPLGGQWAASGFFEVSPAQTTDYLLTATNAYGQTSRTVRIVRQRPPNFLFIAIDDLKPICGFMAENPGNLMNRIFPDQATRDKVCQVLTPNIDRLALGGTGFHRAYCPQSVCGPSRNAIMTGYRPRESGITSNSYPTFRDPQFPDWLRTAITLPQYLRDNGYVTTGTGKVFHTPNDDYADWTGASINGEYYNSWTMWFENVPGSGNRGNRILSPWSPKNSYSGSVMEFGYDEGDIGGQNDYARADFMARLLETGSASYEGRTVNIDGSQPFFLACGIFRPHLPFYMPKSILDQFDVDDISASREMLEAFYLDTLDAPGAGSLDSGDVHETLVHGESYNATLEKPVDDGGIRAYKETIRHYLAASALADRCVGRLLEGLENSGYADNTVVVLWSDHGWYLGEKYLFRKTKLFDEAANCVLVIRDPREGAHGSATGQPCYRTVSLQDLYPTIVGMTGLAVPAHVKGYDIAPLLSDPVRPWNIPAQTSDGTGNSIRFGAWSYIDRDGSVQLYDVANDPDEITNLSGIPEFAEAESMMAELLARSIANDPFPERDVDSFEAFQLGNWGWFSERPAGRDEDPDGDHADNRTEYLLFGNPLCPDLPVDLEPLAGADGLSITFDIRDRDPVANYRILSSTDLSQWTTVWDSSVPADLENGTQSGAGTGRRTIQLTLPFGLNPRFLQLHGTEAP